MVPGAEGGMDGSSDLISGGFRDKGERSLFLTPSPPQELLSGLGCLLSTSSLACPPPSFWGVV